MCNIASGKWDVSSLTLQKFHIGFVFLSHGFSCSLFHGLVIIPTEPNNRGPSSIPRRTEHTPANFFNIVNPLLANNDGSGRMLNWAIWSMSRAESVISWRVGADGLKQSFFSANWSSAWYVQKTQQLSEHNMVVAVSSHHRSPGTITQKC